MDMFLIVVHDVDIAIARCGHSRKTFIFDGIILKLTAITLMMITNTISKF